ncbi:MAG TPA: glycosyltransferase family 2 protein [Propionicimonas sp.]|uniref:glycosyltransferase family 2 protein n=1 Tax=Propionicimonas sp. TaxID=1955623 RepID=UPI002F41F265
MADRRDVPDELRAGVVIVNFGSHDLVERNHARLGDGCAHVVVVDNYSGDAERAACVAMCDRRGWEFVANANTGFGDAVNLGMLRLMAAGCSVLVTANPDLVLSPEKLRALAERASANPMAVVAPLVITPQGKPWGRLGVISIREGRLYTHGDHPGSPRWLSGACLAVSASLWQRLDGFAPGYFMYWEDVDLSFRAQQAGGTLLLADDLVVEHDAGGTQGASAGKSLLFTYYNCRNRLVFAARNLSGRQQLVWLWTSGSELRRSIGRAHQPDLRSRLTRALWPAFLGTVAGAFLLLTSGLRRALDRARGRR